MSHDSSLDPYYKYVNLLTGPSICINMMFQETFNSPALGAEKRCSRQVVSDLRTHHGCDVTMTMEVIEGTLKYTQSGHASHHLICRLVKHSII